MLCDSSPANTLLKQEGLQLAGACFRDLLGFFFWKWSPTQSLTFNGSYQLGWMLVGLSCPVCFSGFRNDEKIVRTSTRNDHISYYKGSLWEWKGFPGGFHASDFAKTDHRQWLEMSRVSTLCLTEFVQKRNYMKQPMFGHKKGFLHIIWIHLDFVRT